MIFDRYVIVDWSASSVPKRGADSIWICELAADGHPRTLNPPTRGAAESAIRRLLVDARYGAERVLVGFDFPYSYPRGFAEALGLMEPSWHAVWDFLEEQIEDDPTTNRNNRFEVASAINARLAHHAFWGRPAKHLLDDLSPRRDRVRYRIEGESAGLSEWREVESVLHRRGSYPQSTWKLLGAGSVGSQALTGIPVVSRLRHDAQLATVSRVWPFEVTMPELTEGHPAIVHAEIWPSLIPVAVDLGQVKDEAQVIHLAEEFRARDRARTLQTLLVAPGPEAKGEGWILGVE